MGPTLQVIINIGAVAVALSGIIGLPIAIVKLWPLVKRVVSVGEALELLPETLRLQNETLDGITAAVNKAVQQVQNSHVTNLRDDVDEVIGKVDALHDKLDEHLKAGQPATTTININPEATP